MANVYPIKLKVGNNLKRDDKLVTSTQTIRQILDEAGIDYTRGMTTLNGVRVHEDQLDKSFAEMGVDGTTTAFLLNVVKADNA